MAPVNLSADVRWMCVQALCEQRAPDKKVVSLPSVPEDADPCDSPDRDPDFELALQSIQRDINWCAATHAICTLRYYVVQPLIQRHRCLADIV